MSSFNPEFLSVPVVMTFFPLPYQDKGNLFVRGYPNAKMIYSSHTGVPYGKSGRTVMTLLVTDALLQDSRAVNLGHVTELFRRINQPVTGGKTGTVTRISDQFNRVFGLDMIVEATCSDKDWHGIRAKKLVVAEEMELFWSAKDKESLPSLFTNRFTLTEAFFTYIKSHVTEVNLEAYLNMQSPRDQDWYAWIVRRMWGINQADKQTMIPWENLFEQFGPIERRKKPEFKNDFKEFLVNISPLYPELKARLSDDGLTLIPSPLHIPEEKKGFVNT